MENNYCILRIEKKKSTRALGAAYRHNYRTCVSAAPYAYESERYKNEELISDDFGVPDRNFVEIFKNKIKNSPYYKNHAVRKNAVPGIEVLLSFSKEQREKIDLERWKEENVKWLQERFGKENVISAMYHDDERDQDDINGTGCHIHAIVIPMDAKGCLNASEIIGNKYQLQSIQTEYSRRMAEFGLSRGEMRSTDRHVTPHEFHKMIDNELDRIHTALPAPKTNEKASEYLERAQQKFREIARNHVSDNFTVELEEQRRLTEERRKRKLKNLEEELEGIRVAKKDAKHDKDMKELRELLGFTEGIPSRDQMHEAKKKLRIANNLVEAIQNYPDQEFAAKVNEEMAMILKHHNRKRKERTEQLILSKTNVG